MDIRSIIEQKKKIQSLILDYLENDGDSEQYYQELIQLFDQNKSQRDRCELTEILTIILKIAKNHHRNSGFFMKIDQIINYFKDEIKQTYSNHEIYYLFKKCNRILLYLYKNGLFIIDKSIYDRFISDQDKNFGSVYFYKELMPFLEQTREEEEYNDDDKDESTRFDFKKYLNHNYDEKREIGENDSYLCEIIREDNVEEFIAYLEKTDLSLDQQVDFSIFESNHILIGKLYNLIQYASFFGAIKIINYLNFKNVKIDSFLMILAIHSFNPRLIHFFEEELKDDNNIKEIKKRIIEAIKCHHNNIAYYFLDKSDEKDNDILQTVVDSSLRYHNYLLFPDDIESKSFFFSACKYNYFQFVKLLTENQENKMKDKIIASS